MISVTRLNGSPMWLNALMVEIVEETPDTYITLVTGKRLIVLEKATDVISRLKITTVKSGFRQPLLKCSKRRNPDEKMMPWLATMLLAITLIVVVVFVFMQGQNGNKDDTHTAAAAEEKNDCG